MINVNFNLLKILNALLIEVHVTNAAKKIHLTQAATSNALTQLRDIFNDPLLIRGQGSKMQLTPLAKSLKPEVASALENLENVFKKNHAFNPEMSEQTFHIGMSDYIESVVLNKLIKAFYVSAPKARLVIHHLNYLEDERILESGELDLALGNFPLSENKLNKTMLFTDSTAFFARKNHPILTQKNISLKSLSNYPIITVNYADRPRTNYLAQLLQESAINFNVNVTVPHAQSLITSIISSDYIAYAAIKLADPYTTSKKIMQIDTKGVPKILTHNEFSVFLYWHKTLENNQTNRWFRNLILNLL